MNILNQSIRNIIIKSLFFFLLPLSLGALEPVVLDGPVKHLNLTPFIEHLGTGGEPLSFEEASDPGARYTSSGKSEINLGYNNKSYWFRFSIENRYSREQELILEQAFVYSKVFDFYYPLPGGEYKTKSVGALHHFNAREMDHRSMAFKIDLKAGEKKTFYIFAKNDPLRLNMNLWSENRFNSKSIIEYCWLGIFLGIFLVMILYNFFIYISTRDLDNLLYVIYITVLAINQLATTFLGFQFLWPHYPVWNQISQNLMPGLCFIMGGVFALSFLDIRVKAPKMAYPIYGLITIGGLEAIASLFSMNPLFNTICTFCLNILFLGIPVVLTVASIYALMKKYKPARFFLTAFAVMLLSILIYALRENGIIPSGIVVDNLISIGFTFQAVLLSFAVADRINSLKAEREAAQKQAIENLNQANMFKDEFLANTSHELRTPLTGIIGIAESLVDGAAGELSPAQKQNMYFIISSGKRLASLVNDILDFSRLKNREIPLEKIPIDLIGVTELVFNLTKPLLRERPVKLINNIPDDLPTVLADKNRLIQIMFNLVGNAVKFTDKGSITLSARSLGDMVEVTVKDTGIGIPKNKFDLIFNSFEQLDESLTRKYGGTGIGLSLTKRLVELHDGEIRVESEVGKGAAFHFTLQTTTLSPEIVDDDSGIIITPVHPQDDPENTQEEEAITLSPRDESLTILIVDDEPINLKVLSNHLSLNNYHVIKASDGFKALDIIKQQKPDLILLDIMMPRISGYEVCKNIRETYSSTELPIIMLTAKNRVFDLVAGFEAGANDYIAKPFSKPELLARIRTHMELSKINIAYSRFVPKEFLLYLNRESITNVQLGDKTEKEMTVLFSDIRSFTSLSEKMNPRDNFDFLNSYLKHIGPLVRDHQGFVDKYLGDGIMALFPHDVDSALDAAVSIYRNTSEYNSPLKKEGQPGVDVGIGIHTGPLMLGTIGEEKRMETTVISDVVNLTSRIEMLTRFYKVGILISSEVLEKVKDKSRYLYRLLDVVTVKGKTKPVKLIELLNGQEYTEAGQLKIDTREEFEKAIKMYEEKKFSEAYETFGRIYERNPKDFPAQVYRFRCKKLLKSGVPQDWSRVMTLKGRFSW